MSFDSETLLVAHGKGDKSRLLYPAKPCLDAVRNWMEVRGDCKHDYLWALDKGRRMGDKACRDMLEEIKAVAGLRGAENIKPHSLRHAFATRMMDNGASIKVIQAALGHANTQTTFQYLHLAERQAKEMSSFALIPQQENRQTSTVVTNTPSRPGRCDFVRQRRSAK